MSVSSEKTKWEVMTFQIEFGTNPSEALSASSLSSEHKLNLKKKKEEMRGKSDRLGSTKTCEFHWNGHRLEERQL